MSPRDFKSNLGLIYGDTHKHLNVSKASAVAEAADLLIPFGVSSS